MDRNALKRDSEKISSFAAEGELLASDMSKGATAGVFVRVHAKELSVAMSNLADALTERTTSPGIEHKVRQVPLGQIGLLLAIVGILFAVGGAAIDTLFSGAYNLAQFLGWECGRYRHPRGAPRFTLA